MSRIKTCYFVLLCTAIMRLSYLHLVQKRKQFFALLIWSLSMPAQAGVLTDVSWYRSLYTRVLSLSEYVPAPTEFIGNSLPATYVNSTNTANNGNIQASYNFSDNGSAAIFDISVNFLLTGRDLVTERGTLQNDIPIHFTTTCPVNYALSYSQNFENISLASFPWPSSYVGVKLSRELISGNVSMNTEFNITNTNRVGTDVLNYSHSDSVSGTLVANGTYSLDILIEAVLLNGEGSFSGNTHVTLTLTNLSCVSGVSSSSSQRVPLPWLTQLLLGIALLAIGGLSRWKYK